jgi:putative ATP-dependent endonuclease of the OLD family
LHIARLELSGFRNLTATVDFQPGLTVLVGENNVGKTNVIDALRLVLTAQSGPRDQLWPRGEDFAHEPAGSPITDAFTIGVTFRGLTAEQRGRLITCLAPSAGEDAARIALRVRARETGAPSTEWLGGDNDNPDIEAFARLAARYTYLPALRDAQADLRPGRTNRLVMLLDSIARDPADREAIEKVVSDANAEIRDIDPVQQARRDVQERLNEMTGSGYRQEVDLAFSEPRFDRIVASLWRRGESNPRNVSHGSERLETVLAGVRPGRVVPRGCRAGQAAYSLPPNRGDVLRRRPKARTVGGQKRARRLTGGCARVASEPVASRR